MKVLHTADWHIGKKLHGYDLLPDQAYILDQILKIAKEEAVDAIVIAGDLYDRSVPSEDSVRLLNQTIADWNLTEHFPLLAISGNHDSAARLATGAPWFNQANFHLHTRLEEAFTPVEMGNTQFYLLPYFEPVDARIYFEDSDLRTVQAAMPKVIEKMQFSQERMIPTILFTGNSQSRATEAATIVFEVADERPLDSQNIKYNSFFGKLLLLMEYIVQEFTQK